MAGVAAELVENTVKTTLLLGVGTALTQKFAGNAAALAVFSLLCLHCYDVGKKQTRLSRFFSDAPSDSPFFLPDNVLVGGKTVCDNAVGRVFN